MVVVVVREDRRFSKVQERCRWLVSVVRKDRMLLNVQWCRGMWLEFVHVLSRAGGFSGIVTADLARAVRAGDGIRFSRSRWFLASAKPDMLSKISRPTSQAGMTGSSSRSGLPVVRSSKRFPRRQHGFLTLVRS